VAESGASIHALGLEDLGTAHRYHRRYRYELLAPYLGPSVLEVGAGLGDFSRARPGGRLLLVVPAHPGLAGAYDQALEQRRYSVEALRGAVEAAGLLPEVVRPVNLLGGLACGRPSGSAGRRAPPPCWSASTTAWSSPPSGCWSAASGPASASRSCASPGSPRPGPTGSRPAPSADAPPEPIYQEGSADVMSWPVLPRPMR
jgi:hypothetical protein